MENNAVILVVEDDEDFREVVIEYLEDKFAARIVGAASGHEALKLVDAGVKPDVVITDYKMPEMSGLELAEKLVQRSLDAPLIFVTGADRPNLAHEAFKLGSFDFVRKPIDASFHETVSNAISLSKLGWNKSKDKPDFRDLNPCKKSFPLSA